MTTENDSLPTVAFVFYRRFLKGYPFLLAWHPDFHSLGRQHPVVGCVAEADDDVFVVFPLGFYGKRQCVDTAPSGPPSL